MALIVSAVAAPVLLFLGRREKAGRLARLDEGEPVTVILRRHEQRKVRSIWGPSWSYWWHVETVDGLVAEVQVPESALTRYQADAEILVYRDPETGMLFRKELEDGGKSLFTTLGFVAAGLAVFSLFVLLVVV